MAGDEKYQPLIYEQKEVNGQKVMVRIKPKLDLSMRVDNTTNASRTF